MDERLLREESGMALMLAIVTMVLVGVMGAGLLAFARSDLNTVVEVNRGQKAFEMADAGARLAEQHLRIDGVPEHYDVDTTGDADYINTDCNTDDTEAGTPVGGDWSLNGASQGVVRNNLDGDPGTNDTVTISIRWLNPGSGRPECVAPETPPAGTYNYFRIISTGEYDNDNDGNADDNSRRRVEAVYSTYDLDIPKGFFTPKPVKITGTVDIKDVSVFSLSDVTLPGGSDKFSGEDLAYKKWAETPAGVAGSYKTGSTRCRVLRAKQG